MLRKTLKKKLARNSKNDKSFNSYLKSRMKTKSAIGPLKDPLGNLVVENDKMADVLNNAFCSVFTNKDTVNIPEMTALPSQSKLSNIKFYRNDVLNKINKLKNGSPGPDKISSTFLKSTAQNIAAPLSMISQQIND